MSRTLIAISALAAFVGICLCSGKSIAQSAGDAGGATKQNLDLPFDALGDSEEEEEAPEVIVFYGEQYEGDGFFFSCDKSSSMAGAKWQKCQREVIRVLNGLSEKAQFGICFYDANLVKFPTSGRPADANQAMKAAGSAMVMSTTTGSGSCTKVSLVTCLQFANQSTAKRKTIVHLSDGHNTCNGQDEAQYSKSILAEVAARNIQRAHINAMCIGDAGAWVDENFMKMLATQNQGKYTRLLQ